MLMLKVDILTFAHKFFMPFTLFTAYLIFVPAKLIPSQTKLSSSHWYVLILFFFYYSSTSPVYPPPKRSSLVERQQWFLNSPWYTQVNRHQLCIARICHWYLKNWRLQIVFLKNYSRFKFYLLITSPHAGIPLFFLGWREGCRVTADGREVCIILASASVGLVWLIGKPCVIYILVEKRLGSAVIKRNGTSPLPLVCVHQSWSPGTWNWGAHTWFSPLTSP